MTVRFYQDDKAPKVERLLEALRKSAQTCRSGSYDIDDDDDWDEPVTGWTRIKTRREERYDAYIEDND